MINFLGLRIFNGVSLDAGYSLRVINTAPDRDVRISKEQFRVLLEAALRVTGESNGQDPLQQWYRGFLSGIEFAESPDKAIGHHSVQLPPEQSAHEGTSIGDPNFLAAGLPPLNTSVEQSAGQSFRSPVVGLDAATIAQTGGAVTGASGKAGAIEGERLVREALWLPTLSDRVEALTQAHRLARPEDQAGILKAIIVRVSIADRE
jgi:hypothetical protein